MEELLKKLLANDVLTEETKSEIETAFAKRLEEASEAARNEATVLVTSQLKEQWINERDTLIEALDTRISNQLENEIDELKEDIARFRDLEIEYAARLVEAKSDMADVLKGDIAQLVEKLDAFLEIRLRSELEELREDFEVVKKNEFGRNIFEAFVSEFKKHYTGDDSVEARLNETEARLDDALTALETTEKRYNQLQRKVKMEQILSPLSGRRREVMEAILKNVDTSLLQEAYNTYLGRVVSETLITESSTASEKEKKVLAEGEKIHGRVRTGDDNGILLEQQRLRENETKSSSVLSEEEKLRIRRLAGV